MLNKIKAVLKILRGATKEKQVLPGYGYEIVVKHPKSGIITFEGIVKYFKLEQNNQRLYVALYDGDPSDRLLVFLTGKEQIFIHRLENENSLLDRAPVSLSNSRARGLLRRGYDLSF